MNVVLTPRLRRALEVEKYGLPPAQAARQLGISVQGFAMRLRRAQRILGRKTSHAPPVYIRPRSLTEFPNG